MKDELKRTPLVDEHVALGARMVDFGGWYMPVQYRGVVAEHRAVREGVGLFDVSHMGEIRVAGKDALDFLNHVTVNDVAALADGQAQYSVFTYPEGTVVDDLLIYRIGTHDFLLVVNAANQDKDEAWLRQHLAGFEVEITNEGEQTAQLAIQGPLAQKVLQRLVAIDLAAIAYYWFRETRLDGMPVLISRTGYTGEDGFECYTPRRYAVKLWRLLLESGAPEAIQPVGLGARDTLRLEARMHLYGNDMDHGTTVLEAGLAWVTKLKKSADFIGKAALVAQKAQGLKRKLVGFEMVEKGIARHGYPVMDGDRQIGRVTSGSHAPTLGKAVGLAYVTSPYTKPGTTLHIQIRNKTVAAVVVKGAFYQRS